MCSITDRRGIPGCVRAGLARGDGERGQALTEMIVIMILLVPILLICFQFHAVFETKMKVIEAARYGVFEETIRFNDGAIPGEVEAIVRENRSVPTAGHTPVVARTPGSSMDWGSASLAGFESILSFIGSAASVLFNLWGFETNDKITYKVTDTIPLEWTHYFNLTGPLWDYQALPTDITLSSNIVMVTDAWQADNETEIMNRVGNMWFGGIGAIPGLGSLISAVGAITGFRGPPDGYADPNVVPY